MEKHINRTETPVVATIDDASPHGLTITNGSKTITLDNNEAQKLAHYILEHTHIFGR